MSGAALTLAAFLQLAGSCAPNVAPETLAAIARAESSLDPLAIGVNGTGGGPIRPATKEEAIARASALIAAGRSVDLGLMQINAKNLGWLGLSVADAFDACRSIEAGAAVLTATSRYNTGHPTRGFANGYVARVQAAAVGLDQIAPAPAPAPAPAAQPDPDAPPSWDVWAKPRQRRPAPPPAREEEASRPAVVTASRMEPSE